MSRLLEKMRKNSAQGQVRQEIRRREVAAKFTDYLIAKMYEAAGEGYTYIFWSSTEEDDFNEACCKALAVKEYFNDLGFKCEVKDNMRDVRVTISWEVPDDEA